MGFTGIFKKARKETESAPTKTKKFGKSNAEQLEMKFEPSTKKDLKEYVRRAREHDEEKKNRPRPKREPLQLNNVELPFDGFKPKAFRRAFKEAMAQRVKKHLADRKNDGRWSPRFPAYEMYEPQKIADSNFVHDVQSCISGFSWPQIASIVNAAAGEEIQLKDWTEGFAILQTLMHKALGVELDSSAARYRLGDRDKVLEEWQVEKIERKRKMPKRDDEEKVKKVRAAAKEEDEEEEGETEEEDEAEDEDDDEDETPKNKSKTKKKKAADEDDAEDEEEESGEDDDEDAEDDEEEKPKKGKRKKVKDEDEEDEDEDEDGDDEPKAKKGKKSVVTKVKSKKSEKAEKPTKKKAERASRNPDAVYKVKKKFGSGVRQQCIDVIPVKGATVEVIGAAMKKKFDVDPKKARSYVGWLTANGYLTRIDD